jgi:hypothetical protein
MKVARRRRRRIRVREGLSIAELRERRPAPLYGMNRKTEAENESRMKRVDARGAQRWVSSTGTRNDTNWSPAAQQLR